MAGTQRVKTLSRGEVAVKDPLICRGLLGYGFNELFNNYFILATKEIT